DVMKALSFAVLVVCLTVRGPALGRDDQKEALGQLSGTWDVIRQEGGFEAKRLIFKADTLTLEFGGGQKKEARIKVQAASKPRGIDILHDRGTSPGIYELQGKELKICFAVEGKNRPTEFKAAKGVIVIELRRDGK